MNCIEDKRLGITEILRSFYSNCIKICSFCHSDLSNPVDALFHFVIYIPKNNAYIEYACNQAAIHYGLKTSSKILWDPSVLNDEYVYPQDKLTLKSYMKHQSKNFIDELSLNECFHCAINYDNKLENYLSHIKIYGSPYGKLFNDCCHNNYPHLGTLLYRPDMPMDKVQCISVDKNYPHNCKCDNPGIELFSSFECSKKCNNPVRKY